MRRLTGRITILSGALVLMICGAALSLAAGKSGAALTNRDAAYGPGPGVTTYVADANSIDVFAPGASANAAPERVIAGPNTGLSLPSDVKVDSAGDIYASNYGADSITEYAPGASGNATPICTLSGTNTGLSQVDDISLEPDGTLVVGDILTPSGGGAVLVFAPGSCGNVAPVETIEGSNTGFNYVDGVGTDASGTIYADSSLNNSIQVFPPGANGNVAPEYTISGPSTGLGNPDDIIVGFDGELYVSSGYGGAVDSITVFAPGAHGDATPIQDITGSNTEFGNPDDLAVDAAGNIYVTDISASVGPAVLVYATAATGNAAPVAALNGPATTLSQPEGVAVAGPPGPPVGASVTTAATAQTISLGQATSDTATVSGGTSPTGSIVFKLFGPGDSTCSAAPAFTSPVQTVHGDGHYASPSFTPTQQGTYAWEALYSGDANNAAVTTPCHDVAEAVMVGPPVGPASATTVTTALTGGGRSGGAISVPAGVAVTDAAKLGGAHALSATGTVTYDVYSDPSCSKRLNAGTPETITAPGALPASLPVTLTTTGTYYWQASYSGDAGNTPSKSTCGPAGEVETVTTMPKCTVTPTSNKVLLTTHKKGTRKAKKKTTPGTIAVTVKCNQAAKAALTGKLAEVLGNKRKHGKQRVRVFGLGPVTAQVSAGKPTALLLKLPGAALRGLAHKANESVTLALSATNGNGAGHATSKIGGLRAT